MASQRAPSGVSRPLSALLNRQGRHHLCAQGLPARGKECPKNAQGARTPPLLPLGCLHDLTAPVCVCGSLAPQPSQFSFVTRHSYQENPEAGLLSREQHHCLHHQPTCTRPCQSSV